MDGSWKKFQKWMSSEVERINSFAEVSRIGDVQMVIERKEIRERVKYVELLVAIQKEVEEAKLKAQEAEEARKAEEARLAKEAKEVAKDKDNALVASSSDPAIARLENALSMRMFRICYS